ncbi:hypothetical protein OHF17_25305, partial [Escherichia coli]|nr:hypothetical protein [Escherichia coli]
RRHTRCVTGSRGLGDVYKRQLLLSGLPSEFELAAVVPDKHLDKYDEYLPESLLAKGYGAKAYDIEGTSIWLQKHLQ